MTKNLLLDSVILLALITFAVVGYQVAPLLKPKTDILLPLTGCDLNWTPCRATLPDGSQLEFSIEPRPLAALKPLQLLLTVHGGQIRGAEVDFAGTEMKMGYNRSQLVPQPDSTSRFAGQASLPVCITGVMEWEATVLVDTGPTVVAAPFRFRIGQ